VLTAAPPARQANPRLDGRIRASCPCVAWEF
jgi:hypothetical protein